MTFDYQVLNIFHTKVDHSLSNCCTGMIHFSLQIYFIVAEYWVSHQMQFFLSNILHLMNVVQPGNHTQHKYNLIWLTVVYKVLNNSGNIHFALQLPLDWIWFATWLSLLDLNLTLSIWTLCKVKLSPVESKSSYKCCKMFCRL